MKNALIRKAQEIQSNYLVVPEKHYNILLINSLHMSLLLFKLQDNAIKYKKTGDLCKQKNVL